jgi:hypothetical protein
MKGDVQGEIENTRESAPFKGQSCYGVYEKSYFIQDGPSRDRAVADEPVVVQVQVSELGVRVFDVHRDVAL